MKCTCPTRAPRVGDPMQPILHLLTLGVGIGGNANVNVHVGGNANFRIFRYQHVGIPKAKLWHWGSNSRLTRGTNANGFALQWNNIAVQSLCPLQKNLKKVWPSHEVILGGSS